MIDSLIYIFTFLTSSTVDVLLWGWWWFLVAPVLLLKWIEPVTAVASLNFAALWIVLWFLYKFSKDWNFNFEKRYWYFIIISLLWAIVWTKLALLFDREVIKLIILISISILYVYWLFPYKEQIKFSINKVLRNIIFALCFFMAWVYIPMVWAWWWIIFSTIFITLTWFSLKRVVLYRMITVWSIIILSSYIYYLNNNIDWNVALLWLGASVIWWYLWALLLHKSDEKILRFIFSIAVIWTIILILYK